MLSFLNSLDCATEGHRLVSLVKTGDWRSEERFSSLRREEIDSGMVRA